MYKVLAKKNKENTWHTFSEILLDGNKDDFKKLFNKSSLKRCATAMKTVAMRKLFTDCDVKSKRRNNVNIMQLANISATGMEIISSQQNDNYHNWRGVDHHIRDGEEDRGGNGLNAFKSRRVNSCKNFTNLAENDLRGVTLSNASYEKNINNAPL